MSKYCNTIDSEYNLRINTNVEELNKFPIKCEAKEKKYDMVNSPVHYGGKDNPYEAIKVIEAWEANFNIGTVLRYLCRCGKKTIGGSAEEMRIEDLKKARWYLDREIHNAEAALNKNV